MIAIMLANASERGRLIQIPASPKIGGSMKRAGRSTINCRERERTIALDGILMLWKKLEITIERAATGKQLTAMRIPFADICTN